MRAERSVSRKRSQAGMVWVSPEKVDTSRRLCCNDPSVIDREGRAMVNMNCNEKAGASRRRASWQLTAPSLRYRFQEQSLLATLPFPRAQIHGVGLKVDKYNARRSRA